MFSRKKLIIIVVPLIILIANLTFAGWKENAKAIKVSGGEDHTLVLTVNKWPWGCGVNNVYQLGIGDNQDRWTLVRVHGPNNVGYLEDINDIAAGWKHSLALDVNGFVWAWGISFPEYLFDFANRLWHNIGAYKSGFSEKTI